MINPNGERHIVYDYQALHDNTIPNHTLLPYQGEIMTTAAKGKIWGKIDLVSVYS